MWNGRVLVKTPPNAVPDVFSHDAVAKGVSVFDDGTSDIGDGATRVQRVDPQEEAIEGRLRYTDRFVSHFSNQKSLRLVTEPSVDHGGDVDIHDIARLQFVGSGNPVADDFVNAGAATFRKPLVAQTREFMAGGARVVVNQRIDFFRRDSRLDVRADEVQHLGIETTCLPHRVALDFAQNQVSVSVQHVRPAVRY